MTTYTSIHKLLVQNPLSRTWMSRHSPFMTHASSYTFGTYASRLTSHYHRDRFQYLYLLTRQVYTLHVQDPCKQKQLSHYHLDIFQYRYLLVKQLYTLNVRPMQAAARPGPMQAETFQQLPSGKRFQYQILFARQVYTLHVQISCR